MKVMTPAELQAMRERKTAGQPAVNATSNTDLRFPTEILANSKFLKKDVPDIPVVQQSQMVRTDPRASTAMATNAAVAVTSQQPDGWSRQDMLSKGLVYKEEVFLRILDLGVLKKLTAARQAVKEGRDGSFTLMIDALQKCVSIDIRDLTVPDLYFIMYWLRMNSFPRSPMTVTWTSKYGNANTSIIREMTRFELHEIKMTKVELEEWQAKGFTIPTVRDMEALTQSSLSVEDDWELTYAQYMYVPDAVASGPTNYIQAKIDALHAYGVDAITDIDIFSDLMHHGVVEQVTCTDELFKIDPAIEALGTELDNLGAILNSLQTTNEGKTETSTAIIGIIQHMDSRSKLLTQLRDARDKGETVIAESEVVEIGTADIDLLFP